MRRLTLTFYFCYDNMYMKGGAIMNLQINSPYKKCPYNCPFCIAAKCPTSIFSDELYFSNLGEYLTRLVNIIKIHKIKTVVLTGDTEPTLFPLWIEQVSSTARAFGCKVEIQTRNYNFKPVFGFNVVAYSCTALPPIHLLPKQKGMYTKRYTFVLNDGISDDDILALMALYTIPNKEQVTIKYLRPSSYDDKETNEWIATHRRELSVEKRAIFESFGAHVDEECDASEGRYLIYRTNGKLYQHWDDTEPLS